jgi:hypothetical protein
VGGDDRVAGFEAVLRVAVAVLGAKARGETRVPHSHERGSISAGGAGPTLATLAQAPHLPDEIVDQPSAVAVPRDEIYLGLRFGHRKGFRARLKRQSDHVDRENEVGVLGGVLGGGGGGGCYGPTPANQSVFYHSSGLKDVAASGLP